VTDADHSEILLPLSPCVLFGYVLYPLKKGVRAIRK
jgi:hypothetical protein